MCNLKIEGMDRAGETGEIHSTSYYDIDRNRPVAPRAALPAQYDASAVMAATRLMVDLGRTIDGAGTTTMISQAAAVLEALGRLPVVDGGVHVALTKVLRGELAAKEAECAELASRINAPSVEQIQQRQTMQGMADCMDMVRGELIEMGVIGKDVAPMFIPEAIANYIKSLPGSAPSVERNAVRDAVAENLTCLYHCGRVWSAWGVGTMSEDDFSPAEEDEDIISNITDAVIAALAAPVAQPLAASTVPEWKLAEIQRMIAHYGSLSHAHWPLAPMTALKGIMDEIKALAAPSQQPAASEGAK